MVFWASKEVFMQKNLNFQWDEQVKRLQKETIFAQKFTRFILADTLHEPVDVESVSVHMLNDEGDKEGGVRIIATIIAYGTKRNIEICLHKEDEHLEYSPSLTCCYYCVEAPAILLDSGRTSVNLEVREDLLERWKRAL